MTTLDVTRRNRGLNHAGYWILATVVAVACVAAMYVVYGRPVYEARAAIEVDVAGDQPQIMESDSLILKAARQSGLHSDPEFNQPSGNAALVENARKHLTIRRYGSSNIFEIAFAARDPRRAAAFANALVDASADEQRSRNVAAAAELMVKIETMEATLEKSEARLADYTKLAPSQADRLIEEVNRQRESYNEMVQRAAAHHGGFETPFTTRAQAPVEPVNSSPWTGLVFGVPMSLVGGLLFFVSRRELRQFRDGVAQLDAMGCLEQSGRPVVAVSNAGTGYTSPATLLDLVDSLLVANRTVLIIDCEPGGALTETVGLKGEFGFFDFLVDDPELDGRVPAWKTDRAGVWVMPAGSQPRHIPALLARPNVREALAVLLAEYDHVVINSPAVLTAGGMRDLSPLVDGVILVTPEERSSHLAPLAARQVEEFGGTVLGLVEDNSTCYEAPGRSMEGQRALESHWA